MKPQSKEYNRSYWAFIYLIMNYPELYLNTSGKIIYQLTLAKVDCSSIKSISKDLGLSPRSISKSCTKLVLESHLVTIKKKGMKKIIFSKEVLRSGYKIIKELF